MLQCPLGYMYYFKSSLSLDICQRVGLLVLLFLVLFYSTSIFRFFFLRKSILFSLVAVPIYIPINKVEGFLFSRPLQIGKQDVKLYANDMILCIGNLKHSTRKLFSSVQFSSFQSLSHVQLFATP